MITTLSTEPFQFTATTGNTLSLKLELRETYNWAQKGNAYRLVVDQTSRPDEMGDLTGNKPFGVKYNLPDAALPRKAYDMFLQAEATLAAGEYAEQIAEIVGASDWQAFPSYSRHDNTATLVFFAAQDLSDMDEPRDEDSE